MSRRRLAAAALLIAFVVAGLISAALAGRPPTPDEEVRAVAATLRCPTCVGESAADSTAPLAAGMREVIADQLAEGRTPDEIRTWFASRYGHEVLLDPPRYGAGWLLWVFPLAGGAAAGWYAFRGRRGRVAWLATGSAAVVVGAVTWLAIGEGGRPPAANPPAVVTDAQPVQVLQAAVAHNPGDADLRAALARALDQQGRVDEAVEHYAAVTRLAPADDRAHYVLAFALVRTDRPDEATPILEALIQRSPDHPESLLLLGTMRQDRGEPGGEELLRRFLDVAPDHPAAADVVADLDDADDTGASG